ncbi:DNA polymerase III subunit delta [Phenylobacterium sp.]|uniref:DNA polymerase III subunit delta n=1 Tax=Phenylobacterium sp. TaxID=1871053 RepID=UPI0025EC01A8|nr:DNA polymerase III subunit delta [Phenylobacterium sp.]MCA6285545.1 DNA polymerase III subunit delta [Phenylobacterium sp.]MCA6289187.1 DNA polymerase III subunit delta [Phenylobacterium sp.]MCA6309438.1 DNA polymerase III subunit delta [Phenylobacterium sp.]MCA6323161.1 DNA polymerase III subunit delta [Phenylobacterium sp.]MCA6337415.1 DNA polymerase III subunit delta [Phenylobacterium sp.]
MILSRRPDLERFLAKPDPQVRAAVIYGRDLGVVRERAAQLARVVTEDPEDPFNVAVLTEGDLSGDEGSLEGELAAQSLMGGRRLVRLRLGGERVASEKLAVEALGRLLSGELNPEAFFLVEAGALGKDSALRRAAEKAEGCAVIPCYEDEAGDVARMTREALAKDGVGLNAEALALFVARLPHERGVARSEIERLALFLGPGSGMTAGPKDLESFLGVEPEASLAGAASDAFGGRLAEAQAGLRRAAQEGLSGPGAVRALGQHLGRLRRTLTLTRNGAGLQEAAKASGVFWKDEREFLRQARAWSLENLDGITADVLAADRACKTARAPDALIAERLALQIAAKARRLGL